MTTTTTLISALSKIGSIANIHDVQKGTASQFTPSTYPIADAPRDARCYVSFLERGEEEIVRLHIRGEGICAAQDLTAVVDRVNERNECALYGAAHVKWWSRRDPAGYHVSVRHALSVKGLTEEMIVEVVTEMLRLWQNCMSDISAHIARNKTRGDKTVDESTDKTASHDLTEGLPEGAIAAIDDINSLVGQGSVKRFASDLAKRYKLEQVRARHGLKKNVNVPHLIFAGDPGTGKTTVARKIGRLYKELGLLTSGHVVEAERASLVGVYLGQTAVQTKELCTKALGGVLFIDEAYSLSVDGRDYGREVLETLMTFMETHRNHFAVVMAGYPKQMEKLLASNPGLQSRFDHVITFENYSPEDLLTLCIQQIESQEYVVSDGAIDDLRFKIASDLAKGDMLNARSMRTIADEVLVQHATTVSQLSSPDLRQIMTVTSLSIPQSWTASRSIPIGDLEKMFETSTG